MIRFEPIQIPPSFDQKVRVRGATWIKNNPGAKRPKDLWSQFKSELATGFRQLCGYSAMYEPVGTVDHFVSFNEYPAKAYDWSNYRFASAWLNSSKRSAGHTQILDPFEVQDGWFEVLLPSLQLVVSRDVPEEYRERANFVVTRLHLGHDERVLRQRREWYRMYLTEELSLDGLGKKAPLIAAAVRKQMAAT